MKTMHIIPDGHVLEGPVDIKATSFGMLTVEMLPGSYQGKKLPFGVYSGGGFGHKGPTYEELLATGQK